jgi:hypothetical protein
MGFNLCFYFTSINHPPSTSKSTFLNEFQSFIGFLSTFPSTFIITGDFIIHMDTGSLYAEKFKHILDACDLIQHVKQPTHIHGYIIDLFISSPQVPVYNVHVGDCVSDHFTITSLIEFRLHMEGIIKSLNIVNFIKSFRMFLKMILKIHHLFLHQPVT